MYAGRLVEFGPVDDILASPRHPYTRLLIESLPRLTAKGTLVGIPGLPPALLTLPPGCSFHPRCPYAFDRCMHRGARRHRSWAARGVAACHLYPEQRVLPPLPSIVVPRPGRTTRGGRPLQMEGDEEPGRAEAEAALADRARGPGRGPTSPRATRRSGVTDLARSDIDEMHRGGR